MPTSAAIQALTANGGNDGTLTVADTTGFEVGATVLLGANGEATVRLEVDTVASGTSLVVKVAGGPVFDATAYTTAKGSQIAQPKSVWPRSGTNVLTNAAVAAQITAPIVVEVAPGASAFVTNDIIECGSIITNGSSGNGLTIKNGGVTKAEVTVDGVLSAVVPLGTLATTAPMTFWVDGTNGSDSNDGLTSGTAFATIQKGINSVPTVVRHLCTIKVLRGTYAETLQDGHIYISDKTFAPSLDIEGQDWDVPVLGSGSITSGTLGAATTGLKRSVSGAAWNVDELKGYMCKITSGSLNGNYYPIAGNTATEIELPNTAAGTYNVTFEILTQAVIVTKTAGAFMSLLVSNVGSGLSSQGFRPRRIKIQPSNFYGIYMGMGFCNPIECHFSTHTAYSIAIINNASQLNISRTYHQSAGAALGVQMNECPSLYAGGCVFDGGINGWRSGAYIGRFGANASGHVVIQNTTGVAAIELKAGPHLADSFSSQKFILRNNVVGLQVQSGAHMLMQHWEITNNSSHGIHMLANNYTACHNALQMGACKITGNGGDGIRMESSHNHVQFGAAGSEISGNTGYGIRIGGAAAGYAGGAHSSVHLDANVVMSTNTAGDLTIDNGATSSTIADLRAIGDKTIVHSTLFNRITGS